MNNESFGNLVKSLRMQRMYIDEDGYPQQWTQEVLAQRANLSIRQVSTLEQGKVSNLYPYLGELANAFNLTAMEKVSFYAEAGYIYRVEETLADPASLGEYFSQIPFPAAVRTPLWDFVAINRFHREVWNFTDEILDKLRNSKMGANLLWYLFAPEFQEHRIVPDVDDWRASIIWSFRRSSFRYITTRRYRTLVNNLKLIPEFDRKWSQVEEEDHASPVRKRSPINTIHNPHYGRIEMMNLRLPQRYYGEDLDIVVYVPIAQSEETFREILNALRQQDVSENTPTFFQNAVDTPPDDKG